MRTLVLFAIFGCLLMVLTPMVSSIETTVLRAHIEKNITNHFFELFSESKLLNKTFNQYQIILTLIKSYIIHVLLGSLILAGYVAISNQDLSFKNFINNYLFMIILITFELLYNLSNHSISDEILLLIVPCMCSICC